MKTLKLLRDLKKILRLHIKDSILLWIILEDIVLKFTKESYLKYTLSNDSYLILSKCYDFSYFVLFTYVFSLFLEVSHGAAALTHFSLTHIAATLLTYCTAVVLTHSIAILIVLPHWCSIYSGQSCRLFLS